MKKFDIFLHFGGGQWEWIGTVEAQGAEEAETKFAENVKGGQYIVESDKTRVIWRTERSNGMKIVEKDTAS